MIARTLEMSVPATGDINGRHVGIYATTEHDGYVLMLFDDGEQIEEWSVGPKVDPIPIAQLILHDDIVLRMVKQGLIKPVGKPQ